MEAEKRMPRSFWEASEEPELKTRTWWSFWKQQTGGWCTAALDCPSAAPTQTGGWSLWRTDLSQASTSHWTTASERHSLGDGGWRTPPSRSFQNLGDILDLFLLLKSMTAAAGSSHTDFQRSTVVCCSKKHFFFSPWTLLLGCWRTKPPTTANSV